MVTPAPESCAVCASPATITDWRPFEDWLAVEGCPCNGFFIRRWLWAGPLRRMRRPDREALGLRIQAWRANGREAWVSTEDAADGRIVISGQRWRLQRDHAPSDPP
jgi:hypothetical protein